MLMKNKIRFTKKQKQRLLARADNIRKMIKDDPERHPAAIIATTGLTFEDDLIALYYCCLENKQDDICDILLKNTSIKKSIEAVGGECEN